MADLPLPEKAVYFVSYDQYKDEHMTGFLPDDVWPFHEYLSAHPMVVLVSSVRKGTTDYPNFLPGELSKSKTYPLATERAKRFGYSMLWAIWDAFVNGYCLGDFDENNIFVCSSGRAKIHNVLFILKEDTLLETSLRNAQKILHKVFTKDGLPIPEDIKHLLDLLVTKTLAYHALFHVHASLIPRPNRFSALIKMHEKVKYGLSSSEQKIVYMSLPYLDIWKAVVQRNCLLRKSYCHLKGNYQDPKDWKTLPPDELSRIRGAKYSDYMRNSTAHRMEPMKGGQTKAIQAQGQSYTSQQTQQQPPLPHNQFRQQSNHLHSLPHVQMKQHSNHLHGLPPLQLKQQTSHKHRQGIRHTNLQPILGQGGNQVKLQEEIFKIDPEHIESLDLDKLFN